MATVDPTAAAQAPAAAAAPALATANAGAPTIGASGPAPAGAVQAAAAGPALLAAPLVQPGAAAGGGAPVPPLAVAPAVPPPPQGGGAGGGGAGGGGGGGGGGGAGPQPAPVGPPFDTYADLFGSLPTGGTNYVAKAQALGGDPARGHVQVLTAAVAFGTAVTDFAYLGFRPTPTGPRGVILLVPDKHLDLPTQGPSGYNDAVLLQLGDVIRLGPSRQFSLATVANGIFTRRTVRAPTEAHLATVLANGHDLNTGIPPFAVGDADGEELQYRQLVPVPPGLAGLLLPRSGHLTVSDAHTYLETFETAQGEQYENIRRLVRAASVMDNNHWPVTLEATSLSEVVPTREILQNRLRILDRDLGPLPSGVLAGLPARAPPLGLDSNQVGTAIGQALRTAGGSGLLGGPTPKNLVTEMEPAALARLLRLAHVASEVELEANCNLWTRLVQCKAKSRPNVLESAMEAARTAHYPDLPRAAPIVSTSLAQAVWEVNCAYVGSDISGGWSAFRFAYGGAKHQEDARARKEAGTIVLGGATATLQDLVSIKALDDDNLAAPTTYVELKLSLVLLLCAYTANADLVATKAEVGLPTRSAHSLE